MTSLKTENKISKSLRGFIPKHVSNKIVVGVYDFLATGNKLSRKDYSSHKKANEEAFENNHKTVVNKNGGFIEDQCRYTDMFCGKYTMQYCGCEIMAVYNALNCIGRRDEVSFPELINEFERDGIALSGKIGVSPKAMEKVLKARGLKTVTSDKEAEFNDIGRKSRSLILTMYNDGTDITRQIHTVCISKKDGKYMGHNVFCNGKVTGAYDSVGDLIKGINGGKAKGIFLIGIK